jgi:diadenylate cyclase
MNWLLNVLREFSSLQVSLADVVDVLLVTLLLYALLVLLRGTRAMQMLWGILIIAGLYIVSRALDLITLSTILGNLLAFLPIAIIVLFQREIRSMLAAFGSRTLLRWRSGQDEAGTAPLNELALAVQALASKRIGALIAVERKDNLAAWAETGIPLDARFSYDLMLNIFIPGTPLHDGAVVLRGSTIVAASCFLPLTTRHRLSSELGTRHRAAIGLTEETDALVIVVSEETGTISLAVEEQLLRPLDETTLRNALAEHAFELGVQDNGKR